MKNVGLDFLQAEHELQVELDSKAFAIAKSLQEFYEKTNIMINGVRLDWDRTEGKAAVEVSIVSHQIKQQNTKGD